MSRTQTKKPRSASRTVTSARRRDPAPSRAARGIATPSTAPAGCTIIARNYLSHARILARSYLAQHPEARFYVLVVDALPNGVEFGVRGVTELSMDELGLSYLYEMCFKYDVTELSTAVKPTVLSVLMAKYGETHVVYLDPDIVVTRPLAKVGESLGRHDIVLIPHLSAPIPDDGLAPSEHDILIAGAYNLGFIGLRAGPQAQELLGWWEAHLRDRCRKDPAIGLMVDQRWIDLVPSLFPSTDILRDDTYNVAYWNLHSRRIGRRGRGFTVNGQPLTFFHFSGFDPRQPTSLSKHQTRHQVEADSPLGSLLGQYARRHFAEGFETSGSWSYGLSSFDNGVRLDPITRRLYLELDPDARAGFGDPFSTAAEDCFLAWVTRPAPEAHGLSPFVTALYHTRHDVAAAFPDIGGTDRDRYLEWATTQGVTEMGYDASLLSPDAHRVRTSTLRARGPAPASVDRIPGVNVCGYIRNESGLGSLARGYISALNTIGVEVALKDVSGLSVNRSDDPRVTVFHDEHPHPVNLVCINADQHFVVMEEDEEFFRDRYNIGAWSWELPTFPEQWYDRFEHYDEIWAGSSMIVHALSAVAPIPVVRVPPVLYGTGTGDRRRGRQSLGVARDERMFLFVFDFHSYFERKNPLAVIEAFRHAFTPTDPVRLVVKCVNGNSDEHAMERLMDAAEGHRVQLLVDYLPFQRVADLMAASDCYVSLHRSEGNGLTIAEAMALGKPVIATGWSGNVDFMDVSNSFPVSYDIVEIAKAVGPYEAGQKWAEPSVDHAAELMRLVVDEPELAAAKAAAAERDIRTRLSPEHVGRIMAERLAVISRRQVPREAPGGRGLPVERQQASANVDDVLRDVSSHVPEGAVVAIVSRGDPKLVAIEGRTGWHFPRTDDGTYAGFHPADSLAAVDHLEGLRAKGATHFVVPATSGWWLDYYADLRQHLDKYYELVRCETSCTIYRLGRPEDSAVEVRDTSLVSSNGHEPMRLPIEVPVVIDGTDAGAAGRPLQIGITVLVGRSQP